MKFPQIKLISIDNSGIGYGPGQHLVETIYSFLFSHYKQEYYKSIDIILVGTLGEERIGEIPKHHGFVRLQQCVPNFDSLPVEEKNMVRLNILREGLKRLAEEQNKLNIQVLTDIYSKIIENNFQFEFQLKMAFSKSGKFKAGLSVVPGFDTFKYYLTVWHNDNIICRKMIYVGLADLYYYKVIFNKIVVSENEVKIFDKYKQAEIQVNYEKCSVNIVNHTSYKNPPEFTFWRSDITKEERTSARLDLNDFLSDVPK